MISLSSIKSKKTRNYLRGALSNDNSSIVQKTLAAARSNLREDDVSAFAKILIENDLDTLVYGSAFPEKAFELFKNWKSFDPLPLEIETNIQLERLIRNNEQISSIVEDIVTLNEQIIGKYYLAAANTTVQIIDSYGYSVTIVRKLLYINSQVENKVSDEDCARAREIVRSALENIFSKEVSLHLKSHTGFLVDLFDRRSDVFETIHAQAKLNRAHIVNHTEGSNTLSLVYRSRFPCLRSVIQSDASFYLASCCSAVDVFFDFLNMSLLSSPPEAITKYFNNHFNKDLINRLCRNKDSFNILINKTETSFDGADIYKLTSAITENELLHQVRSSLDSQIATRENIALETDPINQALFPHAISLTKLSVPHSSKRLNVSRYNSASDDTELRSFAVLHCLNKGQDFRNLNPGEIRNMLGQTSGFAYTLSVDEVLHIKERGEEIDSPIISFLALVMLNESDPSDDREFDLRKSFETLLISDYSGKITHFLDWLNTRTPGLCKAVVILCDIAFLEKLYRIFNSYEEVLAERHNICAWASDILNDPYYLSVAEQLAVDEKIRNIRGELDDSRIYVDEIRFKQWVVENQAVSLRRYQRHIEIIGDINSTHGKQTELIFDANVSSVNSGSIAYLIQSLIESFEEFCHNRIFGIDSYLSRRIRHGTLVGQLQSPIKKQITEFKNSNISELTIAEGENLDDIYRQYSAIVRNLKDEKLQFKSDTKSGGLLNSSAFSTNTRSRILASVQQNFNNALGKGATVGQLADEFPNICWFLIENDLQQIKLEIERTFTSEIKPLLRKVNRIDPDNPKWISLYRELDNTAKLSFDEIIRWFNKPDQSSMSVTIKELAEVVTIEINDHRPESKISYEIYDDHDVRVSGSAYQTVYDLFFVLFDNVAAHGNAKQPINITVGYLSTDSEDISLNITVESKLLSPEDASLLLQAIDASTAVELDNEAMVREKGSGLGKIKSLIESYPGNSDYSWDISSTLYKTEFSIPIILLDRASA